MLRSVKRLTGVLLFAIGTLSSPLGVDSAAAQGRIITFGDSLSDNGNLFATVGFPPVPYNHRFTNGIVWTEILSGGSQNSPFQGTGVAGNVNLAFGGARTDTLVAQPPGIPTQIDAFAAFGGTIGSKDLVTVLGGANNIFQFLDPTVNTTIPVTQASITSNSQAAAVAELGSIQTLINRGARSLLVANLPDIGAAPSFSGTATGSGAATLATNVFNGTLAPGLAQIAAANSGVNIIQMDINKAFVAIMQNPAAFGLANVTQQCVQVLSCVAGGAAAQNQFLFWDGVHPTQTGHSILALYAGLLLNPQTGAARSAVLGDVASYARLQAGDELLDRGASWARGVYASQNGFYAQVTGSHSQQDGSANAPSYKSGIGGVRMGFDRRMGSTLVGGALGVGLGEIGGSNIKSDVAVYDGDVFATTLFGPLFVTAQAGGSVTEFDAIKRATGFGPVTATANSAHGHQLGANLETGVIFKSGGLSVVPSARVGYVDAKIRGYAENGEDLLAMAFEDRSISTGTAAARLRVIQDIGFGAFGGTAFAEVGYEKFFSQSTDSIQARFVGNTALPFSSSVGDLAARGLNLKVGVDGKLSQMTSVSLQYGVSLEDGQGQIHTGQARLKVPF